jgi:hypothetical protein
MKYLQHINRIFKILEKNSTKWKKIVVLEGDSFEIETLKGRTPGILIHISDTKLSIVANKLWHVRHHSMRNSTANPDVSGLTVERYFKFVKIRNDRIFQFLTNCLLNCTKIMLADRILHRTTPDIAVTNWVSKKEKHSFTDRCYGNWHVRSK